MKLERSNTTNVERSARGSGYPAAGEQNDFVVEDEEDADGLFADDFL